MRSKVPALLMFAPLTFVTLLGALPQAGFAQGINRRGAAPVVRGSFNLPHSQADANGNQWSVYQQGWFRQQGNSPLFSQSAVLSINSASPTSNNNQARLDEKTGEILIENMNIANVQVTRRILLNRQLSYIRYVDVFKNPTNADVTINLQLSTNFNFGVQSSQMITDPKSKDRPIGCALMLQSGRAIFELFAAKGSRIQATISVPVNNSITQMATQLTIPAGKEAAFFHLHGVAASQDAAVEAVNSIKETQLLSDLPSELRKIIVNVPNVATIGEREVLRGEVFDVVELRGGDQLKGTISEASYKLETSYGPLELPAERIVALINVGQFRPLQLLVTVDGEVFGGNMNKPTVSVQLSSGQKTEVPLAQIARFGYRKRPAEPEEWTFDKPMVSLRSGERMVVATPTEPIEVMTRYGQLKLRPDTIAQINFESEESGAHQIILSDGSSFTGLAMAGQFKVQLLGTRSQQQVSFPASMISQMRFAKPTGEVGEIPADSPVLRMSNRDLLVGSISGEYELETNFDTIKLKGGELRGLTHLPDAAMDVQVTLWDQTTMSGQIRQPQVTCALKSGLSVQIPLALINEYTNPWPSPSPTMIDRIKGIVADLSADDWKQRERAEVQLVTMGPIVIGVLREMSGSVPPEAQQRIDSVLKQLEKKAQESKPGRDDNIVIPED